MTQHVLLILPEVEDEKPRVVGPFLAEHLANRWADTRDIAPRRRMIQPLEAPKSIFGNGAHALIPSPGPRSPEGQAIAGTGERIPPTEPPVNLIPARSISVAPIDPARGITSWITEEGLALEPQRIVSQATNTGLWKGTVARFDVPTVDGRGLEIGENWVPHFVRIPVPLQIHTVDGLQIVGIVERVHVERDQLQAEGRISMDQLARVAPELFEMRRADEPLYEWPAGITVKDGHVSQAERIRVHGPWELVSIEISGTPIWPGCTIRIESFEQSGKLLP